MSVSLEVDEFIEIKLRTNSILNKYTNAGGQKTFSTYFGASPFKILVFSLVAPVTVPETVFDKISVISPTVMATPSNIPSTSFHASLRKMVRLTNLVSSV